MKKIDLKIFCKYLIDFQSAKDPYNYIDLCLAKSLKIKDIKKIPKKFKYSEYINKSDFFKSLAPNAFVYENLVSIKDVGLEGTVNYLNCGLLTFGYSTGVKENIKVLFFEENFLYDVMSTDAEDFFPIFIIKNDNELKRITNEVMHHYNSYNRFGVKLPVVPIDDGGEGFKYNCFNRIEVFINEKKQHLIDMNMMEQQFTSGYSNKIKNQIYKFRNYFDDKYKLAPNGDFDIDFHLVDFKNFPSVGKHCNSLNAHRSVHFE